MQKTAADPISPAKPKKVLPVFFLIITLTALVALLGGCATLAEVDRSYVNQPAMDLRTRQTPTQLPALTNLGTIQRGSAGGACTVCAH
jgi:hypothetical protein